MEPVERQQTGKVPRTSDDILKEGAAELGLKLSDAQRKELFQFLGELTKWNRQVNLTAIHNERDVIIKHVLDSLSYLKACQPTAGQRMLDMGSGAGLPAFPIKVACPGMSITLVESVKKKASFLRHIVRSLKLDDVEVVDRRIEELGETFTGKYDMVTARAFASMHSALVAGLPFLKTGGIMVLSRGPEETIDAAVLDGFGVVLAERMNLVLPFSDYRRSIWVFKKIVVQQ